MTKGKGINTLSDGELAAQLHTAGGRAALGELYSRYAHLVFGLCLRYLANRDEAKDAVMNIFESLPEKISRQPVNHFGAWIYAVSRNHCLMHLRSSKTQQKRLVAMPLPELTEQLHADEISPALWRETQLEKLESALNQLNEHQGRCIRMFYLEHRSYRQIAEATSFSEAEVKSHIQNGRRNLKLMLTKNEG